MNINEFSLSVPATVGCPLSCRAGADQLLVVPKKGRKVRICGDYKTTVNPCLDVDQYPLSKASDLFTTLSGEKIFPKLDLTQAYHQMEVEDVSCTVTAVYLSG